MLPLGTVGAATGVAVFCSVLLCSCGRAPVQAATPSAAAVTGAPGSVPKRIVRSTGIVQAVRTSTVRVPQLAQISGRNPQLTLTSLAPNGSPVKKGDILCEFDPTSQIDDLREAEAKLAEMEHQREEKRAQVNSDSSKRMALVKEAETDLGKAELQLQKGPVLADLDKRKNEAKAAGSRERLASLRQSHEHWLKAEAAAVRVIELKCDRQRLVVERLKSNLDKLTLRAPHDGMTALENVWRSGSMGPPQVGDQLYPNQPVVRIFDPSEMVVETQVNEPDVAVLGAMTHAKVFIDAYPNVSFEARLESASPVATAGLESPVKSFTARFRIADRDPRLLPDLSASLEIDLVAPTVTAGKTR